MGARAPKKHLTLPRFAKRAPQVLQDSFAMRLGVAALLLCSTATGLVPSSHYERRPTAHLSSPRVATPPLLSSSGGVRKGLWGRGEPPKCV